MMKKVLVLMLVLGMVSVSQAGLVDFYVGGATEIVGTAGSTYTIEVIAPGNKCWGITELMAAEITAVNSDNQGTSWSATEAVAGTISALPTSAFGGVDPGYLEDKGILFDWFTAWDTTGNGLAAGAVLASFSYTIPSGWDGHSYWVAPLVPGTAYIDILGDPYTAGASTASLDIGGNPVHTPIGGLHIIPEPMTIVLLGLGGLFLRRRKK